MRSVRRKRITGRERERGADERRKGRERERREGESEGRTYRIRVYAPRRGRPPRGSRSALTYCSTFVAQSSLPPNFVERSEPRNPELCLPPSSSSSTTALSRSLPRPCLPLFVLPSLPHNPYNLADLKLNPLYRGIAWNGGAASHPGASHRSDFLFLSFFFLSLSEGEQRQASLSSV